MRQKATALRDFNLADVRFGSFATEARKAIRPYTSPWSPKADKDAGIALSPLCADFVAKVVDGSEEQ
jgi:hypothetical protein